MLTGGSGAPAALTEQYKLAAATLELIVLVLLAPQRAPTSGAPGATRPPTLPHAAVTQLCARYLQTSAASIAQQRIDAAASDIQRIVRFQSRLRCRRFSMHVPAASAGVVARGVARGREG